MTFLRRKYEALHNVNYLRNTIACFLHLGYSELELLIGRARWVCSKNLQKGWVCKTWEGELAMINMPGTLTEKFNFTVHDDKIITKINQSMGKRVTLVYEEHVGVPFTCFGDTGHYVTDIVVAE